jgi:hypothetical protein
LFLLSSLKPATTQSNPPQQQNIIIQTNANSGNPTNNIVIGGQTLKLHSNIITQVWQYSRLFFMAMF